MLAVKKLLRVQQKAGFIFRKDCTLGLGDEELGWSGIKAEV